MRTFLERCSCPLLLLATIVVALSDSVHAGSSVILTKENYDETTRGKNVFIKWYDPNCDHCKKVAPEWEKLAEEWKDHPLVMIAEVNCRFDKASERWCFNEMDIYGVPSLMYGEPSHRGEYLQSYGDDKTYPELTRFVNETLSIKPICSPGNIKNCDKDTQKKLKKYWKMSKADLEKAIEEKEGEIDQARKEFRWGSDRLQSVYDESSMVHEKWLAKLRWRIRFLKGIVEEKRRQQSQQQQRPQQDEL